MAGVTREQISRAKDINIEDYILSQEPHNARRIGNAIYLKDHNSLEISNGLWNWHSHGIGGKNAVDYLIKVRGYGFVDAVRHLAGADILTVRTIEPKARPPNDEPNDERPITERLTSEREPLKLPRRYENNERVTAYLKGRGIDEQIISDCIKRNILYESADFHNAVFVGRDENGKARFAAMRTTLGSLKRDSAGSDKRYGFCLPPESPFCNTVFVFESPIDLLSYDTLCKLGHIEKQDGWRLSLGGTSTLALTHLIKRQMLKQQPVAHCVVCTDKDTAGHLAYDEISEKLTIKVSRRVPIEKDWNDTLIKIRNEEIGNAKIINNKQIRNEETGNEEIGNEKTKNEVYEMKELEDARKVIRFINSDYETLFKIKDGESIKFTPYNGDVKELKCRFIDEVHILLIGKYHDYYHICEFAERMEKVGNKYEAIPNQKPKLDVIAAKYGEALQRVTIPMTEAAIKKLVGGKYEIEALYVDGQGINGKYGMQVHDAIVRGKDGMAVFGMVKENALTSIHPYWAQKYMQELSTERPAAEKPDFLEKIDKFKAKAAQQEPAAPIPSKAKTALE